MARKGGGVGDRGTSLSPPWHLRQGCSPRLTKEPQTAPTEKATTEKRKRRTGCEMLSPYEMSLVQTAFGMCAQRTTLELLREAFVKIAEKLTNIDRMIVEEDLD